jgi:hypothetical protein
MRRRAYLRRIGGVTLGSGVAGCSESGSTASTPDEETGTPTATATTTATGTATPTATPTPGDRSLDPYRAWLVAPTPAAPHVYEFSHLSLSAVRADANDSFAERLDTYWSQRTASYFGFEMPVDSLDAVLTVNHTGVAGEFYRVAGGSFDPTSLRDALDDAEFAAEGHVDDFQRFTRVEDGQLRVVGLHPDVLVSIGTEASASAPLETAVEQHTSGDVHPDENEGLALLVDHFGTADFVTGHELGSAAGDHALSEAVATGRRLDVRGATSWAERTYVLPPDTTVDRETAEEVIERRHVGQPIEEYHHDGRLLTVAGEVENSLVRLL